MNILGVAGFTPSRLTLARERQGLTQKRLSVLVGVSDRMIKAYESGSSAPSQETLEALAAALKFPVGFFSEPSPDLLTLEAASFRALTKAGSGLRGRAVAAGTLGLEFYRFLLGKFDLPPVNLPDMRDMTPARAADRLRHFWGVGQKPIANVVHLAEKHGVRVLSLSEDCDAIDAFSLWRDGQPFMFLNSRKTPERGIWDAAHELGHLALHRHGSPQGLEAESQADEFAANFLLPESAIRAVAPRMATIAAVANMKRTWKASTAALGRRMHQLGIMSDWHYRQFNIELSRRGRANEPAPLPRETSAVLQQTLAELAGEGLALRDIAKQLNLPVGELRSFTFGLQAVEGGGHRSPPQGQLRPVND